MAQQSRMARASQQPPRPTVSRGFPSSSVPCVIAHQLGAAPFWLNLLVGRLCRACGSIYIGLYIQGLSSARSAVWALAFIVNTAIVFAGR